MVVGMSRIGSSRIAWYLSSLHGSPPLLRIPTWCPASIHFAMTYHACSHLHWLATDVCNAALVGTDRQFRQWLKLLFQSTWESSWSDQGHLYIRDCPLFLTLLFSLPSCNQCVHQKPRSDEFSKYHSGRHVISGIWIDCMIGDGYWRS